MIQTFAPAVRGLKIYGTGIYHSSVPSTLKTIKELTPSEHFS
jgi:hypothetical protein